MQNASLTLTWKIQSLPHMYVHRFSSISHASSFPHRKPHTYSWAGRWCPCCYNQYMISPFNGDHPVRWSPYVYRGNRSRSNVHMDTCPLCHYCYLLPHLQNDEWPVCPLNSRIFWMLLTVCQIHNWRALHHLSAETNISAVSYIDLSDVSRTL